MKQGQSLSGKTRFLHIPKTSGSTFDECLFALHWRPYLLRHRFVFSGNLRLDRRRYQAMTPAARGRVAICMGHAPLHTGCEELDDLPTLTLLREPVSRVKSFCQHVSEGKSPNIYRSDQGQPFDLDEFLASGRIQLNNFQSRMILGDEDYALPSGDTQVLARQAISSLESDFCCYGLTEDFDRSLLLFRQVLGWRSWPIYRSRNAGNPRALLRFEPRHIQRIRELNVLDEQLYASAREGFYRRVATQCPDMAEQLSAFRSVQARPHGAFVVIDIARAVGRLARAVSSLAGRSSIRRN